jgi:hypothetical protein
MPPQGVFAEPRDSVLLAEDRGSQRLLQTYTIGPITENWLLFLANEKLMTTKSTSLRTAIITGINHKQQLFGCKSRYVKTKGGFYICAKCCESERNRFALDDLWLVVKDSVNRKDPFLFCDNCSKRIEMLHSR